jgi:hypothetical protein
LIVKFHFAQTEKYFIFQSVEVTLDTLSTFISYDCKIGKSDQTVILELSEFRLLVTSLTNITQLQEEVILEVISKLQALLLDQVQITSQL